MYNDTLQNTHNKMRQKSINYITSVMLQYQNMNIQYQAKFGQMNHGGSGKVGWLGFIILFK